MSATSIIFGTDGWRGRIADDYTYSGVRRCAHGFATYLLETEGDSRPVIVGYDKRFASEHFADTAAGGLGGNGLRVPPTAGAPPPPAHSHAVPSRRRSPREESSVSMLARRTPSSSAAWSTSSRCAGPACM